MSHQPSTVPYRHVALLARHARAKGLANGPVLEQLQQFESEDLDIEGRVCRHRYTRLLLALDAACDDPYLWFEIGSSLTPQSMGHLGQLLMTAETLRAALRSLVRFYPLLQGPTEISFTEQADGLVCMTTLCQEGSAEERLHVERVFSGGMHTLQLLASVPAERLAFEFTLAPPWNAEAYRTYLKGPVAFSRPCNRMKVPAEYLDRPLAFRDSEAHQLLTAQCERYLRELTACLSTTPVSQRVAQLIRRSPRLTLTMDAAARQLAISQRTLCRRLTEEGTGFEVLREAARKRLAAQLLRNTNLSVTEVADRVGFDDPSNFARAFSRWHGHPPSRFRTAEREGRS